MRTDLLALTDDDLAGMTNLGTVRRARREAEDGQLLQTLEEDPEGTVTTRWSDGPACTIPGGKTLSEGRCSCPAVGTICRHLLRTVFAYQRHHAGGAAQVAGVWDPGELSDHELVAAFGEPALAAAHRSIEDGILAEVVRSKKPLVRLVGQDMAIRFLVPRDLRYVAADMEGGDRARLICIAVLACRRLPPGQSAGLVVTGNQVADPRHGPLVEQVLEWVDHLLLLGAAGAPSAMLDHGRGLEPQLRATGLHVLADLTAEAIIDLQRYQAQDAVFAPERLAETLGEIQIRAEVIRRPVLHIPMSLVRGLPQGRLGDRDGGRFIGIGCIGRVRRRSIVLSAVVQDTDTGSLAAVVREHATPASGQVQEAHTLAAQAFLAGVSIHAVARGTLQTNTCRREAGGRLVLARGRHAVTPQGFAWERLRDPVLVEDFAELRARLESLPPPCLRARSLAGDTHVLRVHAARACIYDAIAQAWRWQITDADGSTCDLTHAYQTRIAAGTAALGRALQSGDQQLFVSAEVRIRAGRLIGIPLAIVLTNAAGRYAVMPWCDAPADADAANVSIDDAAASTPPSPQPVLEAIERLLAEAVVNGAERCGVLWGEIVLQSAAIADAGGYSLLASHLHAMSVTIANRANDVQWRPSVLLPALRELLQWHRLSLDHGI